ncbi:multicopper oxidase domain-containing protein [Candidatus Cyanaurora vandensis]|uniref:multicopper oxidase domain-containing protein n=1 Tax=Candidatus Cyanaurora vandensis TaxID=2714958 RepID=UPI00257C0264|nr:multicopper oxidase domain-containing protein [Candidatus Cyanaurora vandensis]
MKWQRRSLLLGGLAGAAGLAGGTAWLTRPTAVRVPPVPQGASLALVRDFDQGILKQENGRNVREFQITAGTSVLQLNSVVTFNSWNFNGRVPGPTLRVQAGERVRVIFQNQGGHSHSMHFHGIHRAEMDGVRPVRNGKTTVYEFDAEPYGIHLYHCHVAPVTRHVGKGLYGLFIIDPPGGRPPADELVLVMGAYDVNEDQQNEFYAFNGLPNVYRDQPIPIAQNQLIRLYLLNMIEWDPVVTFHLHANMFQVYPTGRTLTPQLEADVITMGTAERHILEFSYRFPGMYMFHPHQDHVAEQGCMGHFMVMPSPAGAS